MTPNTNTMFEDVLNVRLNLLAARSHADDTSEVPEHVEDATQLILEAHHADKAKSLEEFAEAIKAEVGYIPEGHDRNACLSHERYTSACGGCQRQRARIRSLDNLAEALTLMENK